MTPPIRPSGGGTTATPESAGTSPTGAPPPTTSFAPSSVFLSSPALSLRADLRNPIRSSRPIYSLGDIRDAIVLDFFRDRLGTGGQGAEIVQQLGSFPGFLRPETPIGTWNPDEKPDFNIIGDAQTILRRLAPFQGWSEAVLERNIGLATRGMVYFNVALETPQGPVPFKMGILDRSLWREGTFYFDLRASMLPEEGTYSFLHEGSEAREGAITREEFQSHLLRSQAGIMGRALDTFVDQDSFSAEELIGRRFRHQFAYYERYRVFERSKGDKQRARFEREGVNVSEMIAPGLRAYLEENTDLLTIRRGPETLSPDQVTPENFRELHFVWRRGPEERHEAYRSHLVDRSEINSGMWAQTRINIASNGSSRPGFHRINWVKYGARKLSRWFGIGGERFPRTYSAEASHFTTIDQSLGRGDNPISQMVILAGYGPGDESDPKVFAEMSDYAEAEIGKGAQPNVLFRGNSPSKFTIPVRGVPTIAYRFIDALRSPAIRDIIVVGTPDVGTVLEAFQTHFSAEIVDRGKKFRYVDSGLVGGGFTKNIQQGLEDLPRQGEMAVLSLGDTPRVDIHNVAYHPYRHNLDFILGTNSRDLVLDFMGMNAHYQMNLDGVEYPFKEGNVLGVRSFPEQLWNEMFVNRKSVRSGAAGKAGIFFRYLGSRMTHSNPADLVADILSFGGSAGKTSVENYFRRRLGGQFPKFGGDVELGERIVQNRVGWRADFRPFHLDMGGLVDIDGIRDYVVAEVMANAHPHAHQDDLDRFARETLPAYRDQLPLLEGTGHKINQLYMRIREELLQREAERPTEQKLGITDDGLRRLGFDPDVLPFNEEGRLNTTWLQRIIPDQEIDGYRRAFQAYDHRVEHARELADAFWSRIEATVPYTPVEAAETNPKVERFVLRQLNMNPELFRGLVLEWGFERIEGSIVTAAQKRFGEFAPEIQQVRDYFRVSTVENYDTPLRRVLTGFKAVDVLRRYQSFLSPADFQRIYPLLVESIGEAREVVAGNRYLGLAKGGLADGRFFLRGFLDQAQTSVDELYVRRVGESPPPYRARGLADYVPYSNDRAPIYQDSRGEVRRADTPVYLNSDLNLLARRLDILPSRIPNLIAAASGASTRDGLPRVASERMTYDRLLAWTQSTEGQAFLRNNPRLLDDRFENRLRESGPGLGMGLVSLFGAEHLADRLGIDARHHPHERFMFVVGASHLVNEGTSALTEVGLNRMMAQPFDFAASRVVNAGGEMAVQYGLEARSSLGRALAASLTRSYGLEGGIARMALNGTRGLAMLPFRTAWGMGAGLMSSAIVDRALGEWLFPNGGPGRSALHFGAFFLPDVYRIAVGNRGAAVFESSGMRLATRAFAAGFIADMAFQGINRLENGAEGSATNNLVYQEANRLHDQHESWWRRPIDGVFEMIMPSIAAAWDSHDIDWGRFRFVPNSYQREVRRELEEVSTRATEQGQASFRTALLFGTDGQDLSESFYRSVDFGFLRSAPALQNILTTDGRVLPIRDIAEQISDPEIYRTRIEGHSHEEQVTYIQQQFRGHRLSRQDVEAVLQNIGLYRLRSTAAQLHAIELPQNAVLRDLLDPAGRLREGRESALLRFAFDGQHVAEDELLNLRRVGLAYRILELRETPNPARRAELDRYTAVARQVGVLNAAGEFVSGEVYQQALAQWETTRTHRIVPPLRLASVPHGSGVFPASSPDRPLLATASLRPASFQ